MELYYLVLFLFIVGLSHHVHLSCLLVLLLSGLGYFLLQYLLIREISLLLCLLG